MVNNSSRTLAILVLVVLIILGPVEGVGDAGARPGNLYVVLIGVGRYDSETWPDIASAEDIELIESVFLDERQRVDSFDTVVVKKLVDEEATHGAITSLLKTFGSTMSPNDVLFFHFSGHGLKVVDGHLDQPSFCLTDAEIEFHEESQFDGESRYLTRDEDRYNFSLSGDTLTPNDLLQWIPDSLKGTQVIFSLDADGSGRFMEILAAEIAQNRRLDGNSFAFLTAGDESREREDGHGELSYCLATALRASHSDHNGDGFIDTYELERAVHVNAPIRDSHQGSRFKTCHFSKSPRAILKTLVGKKGSKRSRARALAPEFRKAIKPPGRHWALLVGVSNYENNRIRDLSYGARDAELMAEVLQEPGVLGIPKSNIRILSDSSGHPPTSVEFQKAISWFRSKVKEDDTFLLFFAGHGEDDPELDLTYLLTSNADPAALMMSGVNNQSFDILLRSIKARTKIVFLDSCHSGGVSSMSRGGNDSLSKERLERLYNLSKGEARFLSCDKEEQSFEDPDLEHGVFCYNLAEGLRGKADGNRDGIVVLRELEDHIKRSVSEWAIQNNTRQTPVVSSETSGIVVLARPGHPVVDE